LKQLTGFQRGGDTLRNIINTNVVTPVIQESLLSAEHLGQAQMKFSVNKRLCVPPDGDQHLDLKLHIQKKKANIFATFKSCNLPRTSKMFIQQDRNILQRFIIEYRAPANVTLNEPCCPLIEGQTLVVTLGNSPDIRTCGNYANAFADAVFKIGGKYHRINVVFNRY